MQETNNENTVPTHPIRDVGETSPNRVQQDPTDLSAIELTRKSVPPPPGPKKVRRRRWPWVLLGILFLILFTAGGVWLGYGSAIQLRKTRAEENRVTVATEHFMLGMNAQSSKQYEIARLQFEYVINLDPNFPGAADKLREVMIAMAVINTPTPAPTVALPTLTPTLDSRPQEEVYNQARTQFAAKDWDNLFQTIDALRRIDAKYKAVEVDDMLYVALRYRGIDKILHLANLEGGLYDLALAEQFGPLDVDAVGYRQWARLYLSGSSFWEIDWKRVVEAFEQIYPYFPNLRDSSGYTAIERYRIAAKNYGDELLSKGDSCGAYDYYKKSIDAVADAQVEAKANDAYLACHPPTATPEPTQPEPTAEPTQEEIPTSTSEPPTEEPPPAEPTATTAAGSAVRIVTPTPTAKGK
jgi:cell division septation protein DedD